MAQFTTTIPDAQLSRVIEAYKRFLQPGEAEDMNDPTDLEIKAVVERMSRENVQRIVDKHEHQKQIDTFEPTDLEMS